MLHTQITFIGYLSTSLWVNVGIPGIGLVLVLNSILYCTVYVNSILASLNARTSVRGKGQLEVSTHSALRIMEFASGSGSTPHSDSKTANSGADGRVCGLAQFYVWL
jgi:hypothetical protein